jgi:ABC-type enterochelin transport system substrate-binding protein
MKMTINMFYRTAAVLGVLWMVYACATTTDTTESSSETFHNTTDASSKFTSSTSPGEDSSDSAKHEQALAFSKVNLERIKTDMALGGGEYLTSLATLLHIPAHNQQEFFALTKSNFSTLFGSENTTAEELLARLDNELNANPNLLK